MKVTTAASELAELMMPVAVVRSPSPNHVALTWVIYRVAGIDGEGSG